MYAHEGADRERPLASVLERNTPHATNCMFSLEAGRGYRGNRKQTEDRSNRLRKRRRETLRELKDICIRVV
jgi:hypothetical protein